MGRIPQPRKPISTNIVAISGGGMLAPRLRRFLFFVCCLVPSGSLLVLAQSTPLKFGPLTVTVPPGWKAQKNPFYPDQVQIIAPVSGLGQSLQVNFRTPQPITQDVRAYHDLLLQRLSALIPPGSPQQSGVTGKFIWTRYVMQLGQSQPEAKILYSAKTTSSLYVPIEVEATSEQLLTQNLPAIEAMIRGARLEGALAPPAASSAPLPASAPPPPVQPARRPVLPARPRWTTTSLPRPRDGTPSAIRMESSSSRRSWAPA